MTSSIIPQYYLCIITKSFYIPGYYVVTSAGILSLQHWMAQFLLIKSSLIMCGQVCVVKEWREARESKPGSQSMSAVDKEHCVL